EFTATLTVTDDHGAQSSATAKVTIGDGSTFVTDTSWSQFTLPSPASPIVPVDDSSLQRAVDEGPYGVSPWNLGVFDLSSSTLAHWIWSHDSTVVGDSSTVYFRKSFVPNSPFAKLTITADNSFTVYLNGNQIGSGTDWRQSQTIPLSLT